VISLLARMTGVIAVQKTQANRNSNSKAMGAASVTAVQKTQANADSLEKSETY
jgi:hypothetical protein